MGKKLLVNSVVLLWLLMCRQVQTVPVATENVGVVTEKPRQVFQIKDNVVLATSTQSTAVSEVNIVAVTPTPPEVATVGPSQDLEAAASEDKEYIEHYSGPEPEAVVVPEHVEYSAEPGDHNDLNPNSMFPNMISPETFQQYVNQYGPAYGPYLGIAAYPSPLGYVGSTGAFPGAYVLETGYEGLVVPHKSIDGATTSTTTTTTTTAAPTTDSGTSSNNPFTALGNFISNLAMNNFVRMVLAVLASLGMVFFGDAISNLVCTITPFCDITSTALTYMRGRGTAEDVGRMIAEGMTPERVRRATVFVRNAIVKYRQLQKLMDNEEAN